MAPDTLSGGNCNGSLKTMAQISSNLTTNPFFILGAEFTSSASELSDLVEDAEFDGKADPEELHKARQALVTPRTRLSAELSWLPELSSAQIRKAFALLKGDEVEGLLGSIDHFPELAKANIVAHFCASNQATGRILHFLAQAWDDVASDPIVRFLNESRATAGFPKVDKPQVENELSSLQSRHAESAADSIWRHQTPGVLMNEFVEAELKRDPSATFLRLLVLEYDRRSEPNLARIEAEIETHLIGAKARDKSLQSHIDAIVSLLADWDDINQPVQIYDQNRGNEEERSKRVYLSVRAVCLELANDHGHYTEALQLSKALLHTFPELESVAASLREDVDALESLTEEQAQDKHIQPLIAACASAKKGLRLRNDLIKYGFVEKARGTLGDIVRAFNEAKRRLEDPGIAFLVVRDLAMNLNNDQNDAEAAFRLINGLLENSGESASPELQAKLKADRAVLHKNWKMEELDRNRGNLTAMSRTIDEMLRYSTGADRQEVLSLKSKVDRERSKKRFKIGAWAAAAIAAGVFIYSQENNTSSRSSYQNPSSGSAYSDNSSYESPSVAPSNNAFVEETPPIAQGRILTSNQVRYCVFQGKRLEYMRPITNSQYEINRFNSLIDDYNARCSNFQYRQGTLSSVEREATSQASALRAEARRIVSSW